MVDTIFFLKSLIFTIIRVYGSDFEGVVVHNDFNDGVGGGYGVKARVDDDPYMQWGQ